VAVAVVFAGRVCLTAIELLATHVRIDRDIRDVGCVSNVGCDRRGNFIVTVLDWHSGLLGPVIWRERPFTVPVRGGGADRHAVYEYFDGRVRIGSTEDIR